VQQNDQFSQGRANGTAEASAFGKASATIHRPHRNTQRSKPFRLLSNLHEPCPIVAKMWRSGITTPPMNLS
jgi:hypothetical protein